MIRRLLHKPQLDTSLAAGEDRLEVANRDWRTLKYPSNEIYNKDLGLEGGVGQKLMAAARHPSIWGGYYASRLLFSFLNPAGSHPFSLREFGHCTSCEDFDNKSAITQCLVQRRERADVFDGGSLVLCSELGVRQWQPSHAASPIPMSENSYNCEYHPPLTPKGPRSLRMLSRILPNLRSAFKYRTQRWRNQDYVAMLPRLGPRNSENSRVIISKTPFLGFEAHSTPSLANALQELYDAALVTLINVLSIFGIALNVSTCLTFNFILGLHYLREPSGNCPVFVASFDYSLRGLGSNPRQFHWQDNITPGHLETASIKTIILKSFESGLIRIPAVFQHGDLGIYKAQSHGTSFQLFFVFSLNFSALIWVIADQEWIYLIIKSLIYYLFLVLSPQSCLTHIEALLSKSGLAIYDPEGIDDIDEQVYAPRSVYDTENTQY
ncbi:hypothetical protein ARMSODRAFT_982461 [Armillaria solidipes]|uniref:Uncharacterized protein n=1 Tax=Armillaria solidipes TaxID=1076256 RepID=A0A2H3B2L5_9AGAR|nr:hypothetical protein ARMSODRAFT_982461 [Armillaria solidipes]